jgi:4a-hydroxytetrahydrobiopterin dehydratase
MERRKLSPQEAQAALPGLPGWELHGAMLRREFRFLDFVQAFGFMARVALLAERMNHHPDWSNAYNRVTVELSTHDLSGLSTFDVELARQINAVVAGTQLP